MIRRAALLALVAVMAACSSSASADPSPSSDPVASSTGSHEGHHPGSTSGAAEDEVDRVGAPGDDAGDDAEWIAASPDDAVFTVDCHFSHRASDDPIVLPGEPGASHSHEFFGSRATDADSTGSTLLGSETTCEDTEDTAAYWVPTLSVDGAAVDPTLVRAYYRAPVGADVREVQAPPLGLALISGDHHITTEASHDTSIAGWGCGMRPRSLEATPPADCIARSPLTLHLHFPDCWDGEDLDSADHQSHVARSSLGRCPETHPVQITAIQLTIVWPVTGPDAARATLSSGSVHGAHGDFLNGWEPQAIEEHVELCIHAKANCTIG